MTDFDSPVTVSGRVPYRRVWRLSWPVMLANVTVPMVGVVDTAVMGHLPDPAYIGAVAVGATIFGALYWLFGFLRMATTGLVAQAHGAGDYPEVVAVLYRAFVVALSLGLLMLALQRPLADLALGIFDAGPRVEDNAARYFGVRVWGAPALFGYLVVLGALFGLQRMRAILGVTLAMNLLNACLDLLFVVGFGWGVVGVALGTVISEWIVVAVGAILVWQALGAHHPSRAPPPRTFALSRLATFSHVSANLVIRTFFVQLPFLLTTVLGARLGDVTLAANAILMQFFFVVTHALDAFAHAAESLAGFAFGARQRGQLRAAVHASAVLAFAASVVLAVALAIGGHAIVGLMTTLEPVARAAEAYLPWLAVLPIVAFGAFLLDGVFIGMTRVRELRDSMFLAACGYGVVVYVAWESLGNHAIWLGMTVFMLLRTALLARRYPQLEALCDVASPKQSGNSSVVNTAVGQ